MSPTRKQPQSKRLSANAVLVPEGTRPCPICHQPMQTTSREGETIDLCEAHGIWLDREELQRMFLARTHRRSRTTRGMAERAEEKGYLKGLFWGMLLG